MHKSPLLIGLTSLLLLSCTTAPPSAKTLTLQDHLQNPLFAERYWLEMSERMATLMMNDGPIATDEGKRNIADDWRKNAVQKRQEATKLTVDGLRGSFLAMGEYTEGQALLLGSTLYLGTDFETYPGPAIRVFVTTVIDPRDAAFPDPTARDLGLLQSPYGDQQYALRAEDNPPAFRTVVLWDTRLDRLIAFAQLAK